MFQIFRVYVVALHQCSHHSSAMFRRCSYHFLDKLFGQCCIEFFFDIFTKIATKGLEQHIILKKCIFPNRPPAEKIIPSINMLNVSKTQNLRISGQCSDFIPPKTPKKQRFKDWLYTLFSLGNGSVLFNKIVKSCNWSRN